MESAASGQYFCDYERVTLEPQLQAFDCTYGTAASIKNPGWNCLNFIHVFVGYQANFP